MRICRYTTAPDTGEPAEPGAWGIVHEDAVWELTGSPYGAFGRGERVGALSELRLLAPCEPTKVVCAGRNYRSLLAEQGRELPSEPFLFLKTPNAVVGPGAAVWYPSGVQDLAHEGELAVVVGRTARRLAPADAADHILGYTCANDITVRDWQHPSAQWWRAKSADTHCPVGPWLETEPAGLDDLRVRTTVNGEVRQDGRTGDLLFGIGELLAHVSAHLTLLPGDVVLTGTPAGIRPVRPGDVMAVEVEGIGTLSNPVRAWPEPAARPR
ncbi:fumarylacetoacetate hydrolase family protein [Allonocardiopsis opalescens]|uniref:2-keto-4-pentenoate hydratase/2-oxohepta-3-ene-1,7-dioic acid hydratase in catechol pathway n=1 Tax=Allonocardiopsis opalescens TaxID=1144618 RepID=A0A2T0QEJ8_9ACTN|nr:fumarylacetoacetate hydrolase family protein [Allonocardiopsis opalescens]PRY02273.1 2-keto-4-pentenoate hydratase/2-oxohepta-3-ene-1,7-dioic acid hydratase in catechol pathway [Allonocardiopsis opalescens]